MGKGLSVILFFSCKNSILFLDAKTQVQIGQHLLYVVSMLLFYCPPLVALPPQPLPSPSVNYPAAGFDGEI